MVSSVAEWTSLSLGEQPYLAAGAQRSRLSTAESSSSLRFIDSGLEIASRIKCLTGHIRASGQQNEGCQAPHRGRLATPAATESSPIVTLPAGRTISRAGSPGERAHERGGAHQTREACRLPCADRSTVWAIDKRGPLAVSLGCHSSAWRFSFC